jgi:hypothetical protein
VKGTSILGRGSRVERGKGVARGQGQLGQHGVEGGLYAKNNGVQM